MLFASLMAVCFTLLRLLSPSFDQDTFYFSSLSSLLSMKVPLSVVLLGISQIIAGINASDSYNVGLPSITFDLRSGGEGDLRDVM